jgi:hypothetical protein
VALKFPANFTERLGAPKGSGVVYTYWSPSGDEAMVGWFSLLGASTLLNEEDGDWTVFLELIALNPNLHEHKLGSSEEDAKNVLLMINGEPEGSSYILSRSTLDAILRTQFYYVTVYASDQFANNVQVGWDRDDAIRHAKEFAQSEWEADGEEWPHNHATLTNTALLYHAQREADRCDDYVSVFEIMMEEPEFHMHTPKNMFDLGFDSVNAEDTIGVDADTLTVEQIDAELKLHRRTLLGANVAATGNIHVRIGDLERAKTKKLCRSECDFTIDYQDMGHCSKYPTPNSVYRGDPSCGGKQKRVKR